MKKFRVTLCILLFCNLLMAQNNRQEKRLLKSLKKEYGLYGSTDFSCNNCKKQQKSNKN